MSKNDDKQLDATGSSRRKFLKNTGIAAGGVVVGGALGGLIGLNSKGEQEQSSTPAPQHDQALEYFTSRAVFDLLGQATERIFPETEDGPGAIGLGVPYYIDHQLAGKWGINAKDYRQGPFFEGEPNQGVEKKEVELPNLAGDQPNLGYQSQLRYHQIYDIGIEAIENYSQATFKKGFTALDGEQQDEVLVALENNEVDIAGINSSFFFNILRQSTLEGAYADPLYGGNKDMQGWKMKEYPGVQLNYTPEQVETKEFIEIKPESLHNTFNA